MAAKKPSKHHTDAVGKIVFAGSGVMPGKLSVSTPIEVDEVEASRRLDKLSLRTRPARKSAATRAIFVGSLQATEGDGVWYDKNALLNHERQLRAEALEEAAVTAEEAVARGEDVPRAIRALARKAK